MIVNELFDNPPKIKKLSPGDEFYDVVSGPAVPYEVEVGDKTIIVYFESMGKDDGYWFSFGEVETAPNGQNRLRYNARGTRGEFKVFSAVLYILREFIQKYKPARIMIEGYENKQNELYASMAKRVVSPEGYTVEVYSGAVLILRNDLEESELTLSEGLIKIPHQWSEAGKRLLVSQIITWADYKLAGKFPELQKAIDELFEEHKDYYRERLKYNPSDKIQATTVSLDDLSGSYTNLKPTADNITIAVSWEPRKTQGVFLSHRNAAVMFPMSLDYLERYPTHRSHPDDIKLALNSLLATLEHELRHAVQFLLLPHDDQRYQKPGYEKHKGEYITSPVELDPTIGSAIREYLDLAEYGIKLNRETLARFLAMRPSGMSGVQPHQLFVELKNGSPVQYKRAVKKFIEELNQRV